MLRQGGLGFFRRLEARLTFKPDTTSYGDLSTIPFEYFFINGSEGKIHVAVHVTDLSKPILLLCHGNTGNISFPFWYYRFFQTLGVNFIAYDYPGYGLSEGLPSESGFFDSGIRVVRFICEKFKVSPGELFHYGLSLGGSVAIELAIRFGGRGLVLEAPFTSSRNMGRELYKIIPLYYLVPDRFKNLEKISKIPVPLLIIHGTADATIPLSMSQQLYQCAPEPKELYVVEGGGHTNLGVVGGSQYEGKLKRFFGLS